MQKITYRSCPKCHGTLCYNRRCDRIECYDCDFIITKWVKKVHVPEESRQAMASLAQVTIYVRNADLPTLQSIV